MVSLSMITEEDKWIFESTLNNVGGDTVLLSCVCHMMEICGDVNENQIEYIFTITTEISIFPESVKRKI